MVVACTMGSFGAYLANPTILLGTDYLILKCIKYMAGRMFRMMRPPSDFERMPATPSGEESGTFHFAVLDIVMLRHRRTDLASANWPLILDDLARNLVDQDLDQWFGPIPEPAIGLKKRRVTHDLLFEEADYFVTRPVPSSAATPAGPVALLHSLTPAE
ncbi:unnamed protein product [Symbiodinium sp. CCMP2456]|nr:unnamed protein product [Symbiodinium sp. CCMP2456]